MGTPVAPIGGEERRRLEEGLERGRHYISELESTMGEIDRMASGAVSAVQGAERAGFSGVLRIAKVVADGLVGLFAPQPLQRVYEAGNRAFGAARSSMRGEDFQDPRGAPAAGMAAGPAEALVEPSRGADQEVAVARERASDLAAPSEATESPAEEPQYFGLSDLDGDQTTMLREKLEAQLVEARANVAEVEMMLASLDGGSDSAFGTADAGAAEAPDVVMEAGDINMVASADAGELEAISADAGDVEALSSAEGADPVAEQAFAAEPDIGDARESDVATASEPAVVDDSDTLAGAGEDADVTASLSLHEPSELRARGWTPAEFKAAGATAVQVKEAMFSPADLYGVYEPYELHGVYPARDLHGIYTPAELYGVYSAQDIHGTYAAEEIHGIYSAQDIHGVYDAREIHGVYDAAEIRGVYGVEEIHGIYTAEEIYGEFSAQDIHGVYAAAEIHGVYPAEEIQGVYSAEEIHGVYTPEEIHGAYTAEDIHGVYSAAEIHGTYSAQEIHGVYTPDELHGVYRADELVGTYSAAELHGVYGADELVGVYDVRDLRGVYSSDELRQAGYSASELREGGFDATELQEAGYSADELHAAGFTLSELQHLYPLGELAGTFDVVELQTEFSASELRAAGIAVDDESEAGNAFDGVW